MATSSFDSIWGATCGQYQVGVGLTLATYVNLWEIPGANFLQLRHMSGGSVIIQGAPWGATLQQGTTFTQAQLAVMSGYQMATGEVFPIQGPFRGYLAALGATTIVSFFIGKSQQSIS